MKRNYIIFQEGGETFILQTAFPHFIGKLVTKPQVDWCMAVPNYNLFVVYDGTLAGNVFPAYHGANDDINRELNGMAIFVADKIIDGNELFKKFKIKSNEIQTTAK